MIYINEISKKILYLLSEYKIKPSALIDIFKKNNFNINKTLDFFNNNKICKLKLNLNFTESGKEETFGNYFKELLNFILKNNISVLNISDRKYPNILKQIYFPPPILFFKGEKITKTKFNIAVVGTRKCTSYGIGAAEYISRELSKIGITVVSGMALGIDSYAQRAALKESGGSVGVLGCGIDIVYPPENRHLYRDIIENGSLVSEFFPGTPPLKSNFPSRNRIISGLCSGVVVIEAARRSGAIITSEMALRQNREVFAVPGSIFNSKASGCHWLINSGAKLVEGIDDILEEFSWYFKEYSKTGGKEKTNTCIHKNNNMDRDGIGGSYRKVYEFIGFKPRSLEEIVKFTGFEVKEVLSILAYLELKKLIEERGSNMYKKVF